ncbi:MAG: class I SAM-dependent methyltransferase [Planctomycetota bacterium]|nr:class I SAM-dependent methyltransferase [Planctomycetota bacterium]
MTMLKDHAADKRQAPPANAAPPSKDVFETSDTFKSWDDDYYPPVALRFYDRAIPRMLDLLGAKEGDLVLDAGCGPGVHSIRAAKHGMRMKAIDISEWVLDEARRRAAAAGVEDRIDFQQADLTNLPFESESFDKIFSWGVVIHIPALDKALDELCRILKPGGRLALYVTNKTALDHKLESAARFVLRKPHHGMERLTLGDGCWYRMHDEDLWVWRVDAKGVRERLEYQGLKFVKREAGEFTEIQRRLKGGARNALLHVNNLYYNLRLPAWAATAQLLVFEKTAK